MVSGGMCTVAGLEVVVRGMGRGAWVVDCWKRRRGGGPMAGRGRRGLLASIFGVVGLCGGGFVVRV